VGLRDERALHCADQRRVAEDDTLLGDGLDVHVYHHQALDRVADGLLVSAKTADGVIEAVELPSVTFGVAVQWHPEENAADRRLFAGLVVAAGKYASQREQL
jgi:putative glutamine amidotransferase